MFSQDRNVGILIIGAGCFGLSTAYHLLKRGFTSVTVIDRSPVLPAPDAASTDLNKIVRSSYSDIFYTRLAREAISLWKDQKEWADTYHESGVLVLGTSESSYTDAAYTNDVTVGARIELFPNGKSLQSVFSAGVKTTFKDSDSGFLNYDGGWAYAAQGVSLLMSKVVQMGGRTLSGKCVERLLRENGKTSGVVCVDGTVIHADLVVVATGSWTASTFPALELGEKCLATGQSVAMVRLTPEEAARYQSCPVILDFKSGFYIFPPNEDNIVKMSIHAGGYTNVSPEPTSKPSISVPRTSQSHGDEGLRIPKAMANALRGHLRQIYPELAEKPFSGTRLCWYTDSPDDDWIIDFHPDDKGLMLATAGSGHAYKFLPVIGRLVADTITGDIDPVLHDKFAVNRNFTKQNLSRTEAIQALDIADLCSQEDLLP